MLARLLLIVIQLFVGWYVSLEIMKLMPPVGPLDMFLLAGIFAILVWAVATLGAAMMKDLTTPGPTALLFSFGTAVVFAALATFPDVERAVTSLVGDIDLRLYPLMGAVIGAAVHA